ncbi:MAG: hypothetical protein WA924_09420 [Burkholderiaceae bacterium]
MNGPKDDTGTTGQRAGTDDKNPKPQKDEGLLEKVGKAIDPSGQDVSDAELIDPGSNIPSPAPVPDVDKPQGGARQGSK